METKQGHSTCTNGQHAPMLGPSQKQYHAPHNHQTVVSLHEIPLRNPPPHHEAAPLQQQGGQTSCQGDAGTWRPSHPKNQRPSRNGHNRRVVRVKVILTRAEAARLMSLTAHGDRTAEQVVDEFKRSQQATGSKASPSAAQAISEVKRMEALIARADTSASASTAWRPVLESIPEE